MQYYNNNSSLLRKCLKQGLVLLKILKKGVRNKWFIRLTLPLIGLYLVITVISQVAFVLSQVNLLETFLALTPKTRLSGVNILAFGTDETKSVQRSDTIILFHIDNEAKKIGALSIPRDTRVNVPGVGLTKINHAYAYGGAELLERSVSEFLGVPIEYHVQINLAGVEKLIDQLDGITIDVEKDLFYEDQAGDLYIDIKKGKQNLKGKEAIQFLRFRHDQEGDLGRIRRQQSFIRSFAAKLTTTKTMLDLPNIVAKINSSIKTNMSKKEMMGLSLQFSDAFKSGALNKGTVPGNVSIIKGVSYWNPDMGGVDEVVKQLLLGFNEEDTQHVSTIETEDKSASKENRRKITLKELKRIETQTDVLGGDIEEPLIIEVLNGMGQPGAARKGARLLKELGMDVPKYSNAGSFDYETTLIVDWKGRPEKTVALAQKLFIDPSKIIVYDRPDKPLDATLVIGKDWDAIQEKVQKEGI